VAKGKPRVDALLAMFEGVREEDVEEIERVLKSVNLKKLAILMKELSDNADAILSRSEVVSSFILVYRG
jgi:hypothetical protein